MVLYKRKPVKFEPVPTFIHDDSEIFAIKETGEVFVEYEKYLQRRDYYMNKQFTCESTGHSGLTFFEAQESEMEASIEINTILPEQMRSRVLEFVQFRTTPRLDDLVNVVFDHFRENFSVGDRVTVDHEGGPRKPGLVVEVDEGSSGIHNIFTSTQGNEDLYRSVTYVVELDSNDPKEPKERVKKYKTSELHRERSGFSKLVLKQFLRSTVTREPWNSAPWMVKEHLAKKYDIPTTIPEAKTREAIMAAKKEANARKLSDAMAASRQAMQNGLNVYPDRINGQGPVNGRPTPPAHGQTSFVNYSASATPQPRQEQHRGPSGPPGPPQYRGPPTAHVYYQPHMNGHPAPYPPGMPHHGPFPPHPPHPHLTHMVLQHPPPNSGGLPINLPFQNNFMQYQALAPTNAPAQQPLPPPKPFEPVKYPMEDLRIKQPRNTIQRPTLKFISDDVPEGVEPPENKTGILMKSVGSLLCLWDTLNVHDEIYSLDSFTFDDFVEAMCFSSEEVDCELLIEAHCAVLKQIVNEKGHIKAPLPGMESEESDEEGSDKSPTPEREPTPPPPRTTRSSLRKSEANAIVVSKRTPTPEPPKQLHKAAEFLADFDWIEQCKIRNFREGGWQAILVGLLYRLSFSPVHKEACNEILAVLVPPEDEPSVDTIRANYLDLDVNLRISALDMALQLTVATEMFRDVLAKASQDMTKLRKEKIEHQKRRRELAEELFKLDTERKILLPQNMPVSPVQAKADLAGDVSMASVDDAKDEEDEEKAGDDSQDGSPVANRKLRHTGKNKRKRESDAVKKEKAKKAKVEAAKTRQQREWEALLDTIEQKKEELKTAEAAINELDDDLREALVHRSKIIGKDRFLNKYYWFEHNGMPFGGVPTSSTAEYGYANGRLWVQGPDEYELGPNLEEPALSDDRRDLGFTIPERKEKEEGDTHLSTSTQWGYYDDPEDLDKLLSWLDDRGLREKQLRKELTLFRDRIAEYMVKMKEHLSEAEKAKEEGEENATRVSTRTKTYIDKDVTKDRCLLWTNSIMREEFGYSHSEEYQPARKVKKGTAKATKGKGKKN